MTVVLLLINIAVAILLISTITRPHQWAVGCLISTITLNACDNNPQLAESTATSTPIYVSLSTNGEEILHAVHPHHFNPTTLAALRQTPSHQHPIIHQSSANATVNSSAAPWQTKTKPSSQSCNTTTTWFMGECVKLQRFYVWQNSGGSGDHLITRISPQAQHACLTKQNCDQHAYPNNLTDYTYLKRSFMAMVASRDASTVQQYGYPIYALISPQGHQYLTRSHTEQANLTQHYGYNEARILFYVASGKSFGDHKIYRYKHLQAFNSLNSDGYHYQGPWHYDFGQSTEISSSFDGSLGWVLSSTSTLVK